jgi:hypothetical protein
MKASTVLLALLLVPSLGVGLSRATQGPLEFSCTTFPPGLSESDLVARYGPENVVSAQIIGADDAPFEGTVLFPDLEGARVDIAWQEPSRSVPWRGFEFRDSAAAGGYPMESLSETTFRVSNVAMADRSASPGFRLKVRGLCGPGVEVAFEVWTPVHARSRSRSSPA